MRSESGPFVFDYRNLSGRRPGRLLSTAGRVLPGIARVQADVLPFARAWRTENLAALGLADDGTVPEPGSSDEHERPTPLWVALGDSLTLGIGAPAYDRGWVGQLRDRFAAQGLSYRVVNLGVSGARTADLIERQLPVLETLSPDLVTVMIGSNDLSRPRNRRCLVERFEQLLPRLPAGTVVTTLPNPTRVATRVNAAINRVATSRSAGDGTSAGPALVVAELRDPRTASWRGKLAPDHFHPNERGYAAIAEVIGDVILARRAEAGHGNDRTR